MKRPVGISSFPMTVPPGANNIVQFNTTV